MYNYYLQNNNHQIDYLICPKPDLALFENVCYSFVKPTSLFNKVKTKLKIEHRLQSYFLALDRIIESNQKYIIQIVDNSGIVFPLNRYLSQNYQISDFYLFPTLWKEGFGIVLAEALKCGCYCIASIQGGVPEVLDFGKLGTLIENPNFLHEWIEEIELGIREIKSNGYVNPFYSDVFDMLFDLDEWSNSMNNIITQAKLSFSY
jgi:glycosyltransferase involved in cell wall biosynthesis